MLRLFLNRDSTAWSFFLPTLLECTKIKKFESKSQLSYDNFPATVPSMKCNIKGGANFCVWYPWSNFKFALNMAFMWNERHLKFRFSKKATKFETISHMIWSLVSRCQTKWEIVSNFCALFRMSELYHVERTTLLIKKECSGGPELFKFER